MVKEIFIFFFFFFLSLQLPSSFTKNSSEVVSREGSMLPPPCTHGSEKTLRATSKPNPIPSCSRQLQLLRKFYRSRPELNRATG